MSCDSVCVCLGKDDTGEDNTNEETRRTVNLVSW